MGVRWGILFVEVEMAFIQCDFFSSVLSLSVSMNVVLPQPVRPSYPVLYLLHGMSDDHTIWMRRSSIGGCGCRSPSTVCGR